MRHILTDEELSKFTKWLEQNGAEILPVTNEYERLRFRGIKTGVLYKTGRTANAFVDDAIKCWKNGKKWNGKPLTVKRNTTTRKKEILLERDGRACFYCMEIMKANEMSIDHLIAIAQGGQNTFGNMVLCHAECNQKVGNWTVVKKVNYALKNRVEKIISQTIKSEK